MTVHVFPFTNSHSLSGPLAMRERAEAAFVQRLEQQARAAGLPLGGQLTFVHPEAAARVNVVLLADGSEVTVLNGEQPCVTFRKRAAGRPAQPTIERLWENGDWRCWFSLPGWHKLVGAPTRLSPAFGPTLVQSGVTTPQGSSHLPAAGKRQDRRRLEPVIARRLQILRNILCARCGSTASYAENGTTSVLYSCRPNGLRFRIMLQKDGALSLTGVVNSFGAKTVGILDIRTWKNGFEEAFLSNDPWTYAVPVESIT